MITLPSADKIACVYDFKTILETALQNMFFAAGFQRGDNLNVITAETPVSFQSATPRVDLSVRVGENPLAGGHLVNSILIYPAYKGTLTTRAVTKSNQAGKQTHGQYRAQIFFMCGIMGWLVNNQPNGLTKHKIHHPVRQTGTTDVFSTKDSFEYSDANFVFDFSIMPAALNEALCDLKVTQPSP